MKEDTETPAVPADVEVVGISAVAEEVGALHGIGIGIVSKRTKSLACIACLHCQDVDDEDSVLIDVLYFVYFFFLDGWGTRPWRRK
jgi:hypothetical protein